MTEKKYLTLKQAQAVADDLAAVEEAVKERGPAAEWAGRCHEMSLAVLRTGLFGPGRVARGGAQGILGQHSWITLGDPYDRKTVVADPTYIPATTGEAGILVTANMRRHWPQGGAGDIWTDSGPPPAPTGKVVELEGFDELSPAAPPFPGSLRLPAGLPGVVAPGARPCPGLARGRDHHRHVRNEGPESRYADRHRGNDHGT